jgi:lysophospholipase L1-like esterase
MAAMRDAWTDERLDDLSRRMDRGFDRVDADLRAMDARFDSLHETAETLRRTVLQVGVGLIAGLVGVIASVIVLAFTATADASPGAGPAAIVALGDSFISGEGGRWLGNGSEPWGTRSGTDRAAVGCAAGGCDYEPALVYGDSEANRCHRSDVAPILSAPVAVAAKVNLACSGAKLANLWPAARGGSGHFGEPPQIDRLAAVARRDDVRMVLVSAGANDVGFGRLVAGCALDWARSSERRPAYCRASAQAEVEAALPAMEWGLEKVLRSVHATLGSVGYDPGDYRLVTMGYASPFPAGGWIRYPEWGWSRLNQGGCPVWSADADWAGGEGIDAIGAALRRAAAASGAEFLDLRHALDGHQLCDRRARRIGPEGPDPAGAEWVRRLAFVQGSSRESLHPNAYGQRAIGACIGFLYAGPRGDYSCRATPGRSYVDGVGLEPSG